MSKTLNIEKFISSIEEFSKNERIWDEIQNDSNADDVIITILEKIFLDDKYSIFILYLEREENLKQKLDPNNYKRSRVLRLYDLLYFYYFGIDKNVKIGNYNIINEDFVIGKDKGTYIKIGKFEMSNKIKSQSIDYVITLEPSNFVKFYKNSKLPKYQSNNWYIIDKKKEYHLNENSNETIDLIPNQNLILYKENYCIVLNKGFEKKLFTTFQKLENEQLLRCFYTGYKVDGNTNILSLHFIHKTTKDFNLFDNPAFYLNGTTYNYDHKTIINNKPEFLSNPFLDYFLMEVNGKNEPFVYIVKDDIYYYCSIDIIMNLLQ